jgi:hypothetical protein
MWQHLRWGFTGWVYVTEDRFTWVPSNLRSIRAISIVESMEVKDYTTVLSPTYDMYVYMANTFGR